VGASEPGVQEGRLLDVPSPRLGRLGGAGRLQPFARLSERDTLPGLRRLVEGERYHGGQPELLDDLQGDQGFT
jgi:hypothetical protein